MYNDMLYMLYNNLLTSGIFCSQLSKLPEMNTSLPLPSQRNTVGNMPSPCDEAGDVGSKYGSYKATVYTGQLVGI